MCTVLRFSDEEMRRMRVRASACPCPLCHTPCIQSPFWLPSPTTTTHIHANTQAARGAVSAAAASSSIAGDVTQWASSLFSAGAASTPGGGIR